MSDYDRGYDQGYEDGYSEGKQEGYDDGYADAEMDCPGEYTDFDIDEARDEGYEEGYAEAKAEFGDDLEQEVKFLNDIFNFGAVIEYKPDGGNWTVETTNGSYAVRVVKT